MALKKLRLIPLGGLGEIGINCMVLEWEDSFVLIDCGAQFPDASYPGVELLLPDLNYVIERFDKMKGVVVTHGHEDHIGAIPYLARHGVLNIYSSAFPRGIIQHKLGEHPVHSPQFHHIEPGTNFKVGPFEFHPVCVQHSIIEALALGIRTPAGLLVHSGDFKHDPEPYQGTLIDLEPFESWGKEGVHILLSDSTNSERSGRTISENDIARAFEKIIQKQDSRIIIALFTSNIRRVEQILRLSHQYGKKVGLVGRSMHTYTRIAQQNKILEIPEDTLILAENSHEYPDNQVIILATGSQAEPQSALMRMAQGNHREVKIKEGDNIYFSSRIIPGNEKAISEMVSLLYRRGARVLFETEDKIHVSGHGYAEELQMLHRACRPKYFIPVHGEYRHMAKHALLAKEAGVEKERVWVVENGEILETDGVNLARVGRLDWQKTPVVMGTVMQKNVETYAHRRGLAKAGIVFCAVVRKKEGFGIVGKPAIQSYGLLYKQGESPENRQIEAEQLVTRVYEDNATESDVAEVIRRDLRRFYKQFTGYKPIVLSHVMSV